jgi:hypothetical protein
MTPREKILAARQAQQQGMTPREKILAARQAQAQGQPAQQPEPEPAKEEFKGNWYDTPRAILDGATFGFADEIGAGVAAGAFKLLNDTDRSFKDVYRGMKDDIDKDKRAYQEENPISSTALNIGGSLASGSAVFSGLGKLAGGANAMLNSTRAGQAVGQTAANIAGRTPVLSKTLGAGTKLAATGAIEGGLAGAGASDNMDDIVSDVKTGAAIGAVAAPALGAVGKGIGKVGGELIRRRIPQSLNNADGTFTDINFAGADTNPRLQHFYQKLVAPSFGGTAVRDRAGVVLDAAQGKIDDQTRNIRGIEDEVASLKLGVDEAKALRTQKNSALEFARAQQADVKTTGFSAEDAKLRREVIDGGIPSGADDATIAAIRQADGMEANRLLQNAWRDTGFSSVNTANLKITPDTFINSMVTKYTSQLDKQGSKELTKLLKAEVKEAFKRQNPDKTFKQQGDLSGKSLMDIRNSISQKAAQLKKDQKTAPVGFVLQKGTRDIDDFIRKQLDPQSAKQFDDDLMRYGNKEAFREATQKATATGGGLATDTKIIQARNKYNPKAVGRGEDDLANAAMGTQNQKQTVLAKAIAKRQEAELGVAEADRGVLTATERVSAERSKLPLTRRAKQTETENLRALKKLAPNLKPAMFESAFATSLLAAPFEQMFKTSSLITGGLVGKLFAGQTMQRALAGQTVTQEAAVKMFKQLADAGMPQKTISALSREIVTTENELSIAEDEQ